MDTSDKSCDEQKGQLPAFMRDIATLILAITFLSTLLSFLFNLSYFLSFNPSFLLLFSTTDYLSTGVYFVAMVVAIATWLWLSETYKGLFLSKKQFEKKKREDAARKSEQEEVSKKIEQIKDASSYEDMWKKANDVVKPIKRDFFLSRLWIQLFGVAVWILFAFPRLDWLAVSLILNAILGYAPILFKYRPYSQFERSLLVYLYVIIVVTFYAGAVFATELTLSQSNARIVYEQNGNLTEIKGGIVRVLSKSVIIKTNQGFSVLDRDTPLQIFYDKRKNAYNVSGFRSIMTYIYETQINDTLADKKDGESG